MSRYGYEVFSEYVNVSCPERHLLAAILERACRDLGFSLKCQNKELITTVHADRRSAVVWFNSADTLESNYLSFSFKQVSEVLGLSESQLEFLRKKVEEAQIILNEECKKFREILLEKQKKFTQTVPLILIKSFRDSERRVVWCHKLAAKRKKRKMFA